MRTLLSVLLLPGLLVLLGVAGLAGTIHVPGDHPTIQQAIAAAVDGDTVLVAPGVYVENIDFLGRDIVVTSHVLLDGDPQHILETVIDGSQPVDPDVASCVRIVSGETRAAVLEGFTLTGGRGTRWQDIHNGQWYREGGGVLVELSSPTVRRNLIRGNQAVDTTGVVSAGGGGIRIGDGNPRVQNNVIMDNEGRYGAGIVLNYATGVIRNNVIYRNRGGEDYGGSGVWTYAAGDSLLENNTIVANSSVRWGGGLLVWRTSVTCRNNILWGNSSQDRGDQIFEHTQGTAVVTYCDVQGGWIGPGNIDADPGLQPDRFLLPADSPAVDAGDPDGRHDDPEDPARPGQAEFPSMGLVRNDMGVYGGPHRRLLPVFESLQADRDELSAGSGGVVSFVLAAGMERPGRRSLIFCGMSGTDPGFDPPGGSVTIPIHWDALTSLGLALVNTPVFDGFLGTLDGAGVGAARFDPGGPLPPAAVGLELSFAYGLLSPWDFASNPVTVTIVP